MDIALYRASSGAYIAVHDCMLPSVEAEHTHGPLEFQGVYTVADATMQAFAQLNPELDAHDYAVLDDEAARLLASGKQQADCKWPRRGAGS